MKVIKHGNTYKQYKCKECSCLVEVVGTDIQSYNNGSVLLNREPTLYNRYFICPECGNKVVIEQLEMK